MTKTLFPVIYIFSGVLFLLISTVFYPGITDLLLGAQNQSTISPPSFWNLSVVLGIVRIIFIIVGAFLTLFGLGMLVLKRRWPF